MRGNCSECSSKLHNATELRSFVHSVSRGSCFTLEQNGAIGIPLEKVTTTKLDGLTLDTLVTLSDIELLLFVLEVHPFFTTLHSKVTAQVPAPHEGLCHAVVGAIPARVLHQSKSQAGVDGVLGVRSRHSFILMGITKRTGK